MSDDALCFLSASELGRRIARRELSPVEVTRAHLARIARLDAKLNAFLTVTVDRALAEAAAAEREIAAGESRGPLHGVPVYSISIALIGGIIWSTFGFQYVFLMGVFIAALNFVAALQIRLPKNLPVK